MPIKILMPALSPTMKEGTLSKWFKKKGDEVKAGDVIAEIETDKALMEVEAVDEGYLAEILVQGGSHGVKVNELIAVLRDKSETDQDVSDFISNSKSHQNIEPSIANEDRESDLFVKQDKFENFNNTQDLFKKRIIASPLAKNIAKNNSIDLSKIIGTGPYGRIVKSDVLSYKEDSKSIKESHVSRKDDEFVLHTPIRKVIAERLLESKQNIPHFYLSVSADVQKLISLREEINSSFEKGSDQKISVNDFITKLTAKALAKFNSVNSSYTNSGIVIYGNVDISVAVSIEGGLITPIVRNADRKSLLEISSEIKELALKAREGRLIPSEFQGGGFTISNLGMYGIESFNAIINPPQAAILAVGAAFKTPVIKDNQIIASTVMNLTLSCDHRVIDGALGSEFLNYIKNLLENPIQGLL